MRYVVRRSEAGRTWDVVDTATGQVIEGGFFARGAAERCAREENANA